MDMVAVLALLNASLEAATLAQRALEAANNGDDAEADRYLAEARAHYASARQGWDDA